MDAAGPADGYEQSGPGLVTYTDAAFAGHVAVGKVMAWMNVLSPQGSFSPLVKISAVEVKERSQAIGGPSCGQVCWLPEYE